MPYQRPRHQPSRYRFLLELKPAAWAIIAAYALETILGAPCAIVIFTRFQETCRFQAPSLVWWGFAVAGIYGVSACLYRYYRDFHLGEYWVDLDGR
jgi:hypothetical protein